MKKYKFPNVTQYDMKICRLFAKYCIETNIDEYARRNQTDINKIRSDIYHGKLAEMMTHKLFIQRGMKPNPVDFGIYEESYKSYDADILTKTKNIHVKSCLGSSPFPNSWLFQPNDHLVSAPTDHDILVLCVLNKPFNDSYCYRINAIDAVYHDPIKKSLHKKVIYEEKL